MTLQFDSEKMLEGIREWVLVESPTYHREGVNRMMDLAEKEMADLRCGRRSSSACHVYVHTGRRGRQPHHARSDRG